MTGLAFPKPPKRVKDPRLLRDYKRRHAVCEACAVRRSEDVHHLVSRQKSGGDVEENLLALCRRCHRAWADVNRTRRQWLADHEAAMTVEARAKVKRALRMEED